MKEIAFLINADEKLDEMTETDLCLCLALIGENMDSAIKVKYIKNAEQED